MKVMKPKAKASKPKAGPSGSRAAKATKDMRRLHKLEKRRKEKKALTADDWNAPVPSHLVAKLDVPRVKSKYQSYFEFAENSEKKEKRLEFGVGTLCSQCFLQHTDGNSRSPTSHLLPAMSSSL